MAKDYKPEDILFPDQKIIQSELVHEMQTSYIEYAMSVIVGRARRLKARAPPHPLRDVRG